MLKYKLVFCSTSPSESMESDVGRAKDGLLGISNPNPRYIHWDGMTEYHKEAEAEAEEEDEFSLSSH